MPIQDQGNTRPYSADTFRFTPYFRGDNVPLSTSRTTKGSEICNALLLDQYKSSPLFQAYLQAFIDEMDTLFYQLDEVYFGRFLDRAVGHQLDVIGRIINQSRQVSLTNIYFGFQGAANADKMSAEATPADGGVFKSEADNGFTDTPLSDTVYRRLLKAKASVHSRHEPSVNNIYNCTAILLGRIPRMMRLEYLSAHAMDLRVSTEDVTAHEASLLLYFAQYMSPLGTSLIVTREV